MIFNIRQSLICRKNVKNYILRKKNNSLIELKSWAIHLKIYLIYSIISFIMLPSIFICMLILTFISFLKILTIEINFKLINLQGLWAIQQELGGKIECLIENIIQLQVLKELSMELWILQMILKESSVVQVMDNHIFC